MSWRESIYRLPWEHYVVDTSEVESFRVCESVELFGSSSSLEMTALSKPYGGGLLNLQVDSFLSIVVLIVVVLYCFILYRYSGIMQLSLKNVVSLGGVQQMFISAKKEFLRFVSFGELLCIVSISALLVKYVHFGGLNFLVLFAGIFLSLYVVRLWGIFWQRIFSYFDYRGQRWSEIRNLTRFDFAILSIVSTPLVVVLLPLGSAGYLELIGLVVAYLYHFLRIVVYFKSLRFSFLQSFLYLCAVEIVPIALLWGVLARIILL